MFVKNNTAASNAATTQINRNITKKGLEHSAAWVRPRTERFDKLPRCCPPQVKPDTQAMIGQLKSLISMLSDLLRQFGGRAGTPVPTKPIEVKPMPDELQRFVGMSGRDAEAKARQEGITKIRVITPFQPVTADYQRDRLNLKVDDSGTVTRADWY
jgi:hypothetical protein